jgi:hypothetical protein
MENKRLFFRRKGTDELWHLCYFCKQLDKYIVIAKIKARRKDKNQYSIKVYEFRHMKLVYEFLERKQHFNFTAKQIEFNLINC